MRAILHNFSCLLVTKRLPYETLLFSSITIKNIYLQEKLL
ncbi:uncharacterized protein CHAB577_0457 [Chlamydia abortus]|nr:uncharacterized protein CHAB577_0457 [Chlamydia abortus]